MFKKIIYIIILTFLATSCADTFQSVKRGLTGEKANAADEFLVQKKDPLILPPDYENLPSPDEGKFVLEENSIFQDTLDSGEDSSTSTSIETSILKKIQSK